MEKKKHESRKTGGKFLADTRRESPCKTVEKLKGEKLSIITVY